MRTQTYTDKDFARFTKAVGKWVSLLGLTEWAYDTEHSQIGEGTAARCAYNCVSKKALFQLTLVAEGDYGFESDMHRLALHEVLHLLMADYAWLASRVKDDRDESTLSHEHEIVHRLMAVLLPA